MTLGTQPPSIPGEFSSLKRRVDALERKLNQLLDYYRPEIVFSFAGELAEAESPPWTRREAGRIVETQARLRVPGSTGTEIEVLLNGVVEATVTIPADEYYARVTMSIEMAPDQDVLQVRISTAGNGATDLTVTARFNK